MRQHGACHEPALGCHTSDWKTHAPCLIGECCSCCSMTHGMSLLERIALLGEDGAYNWPVTDRRERPRPTLQREAGACKQQRQQRGALQLGARPQPARAKQPAWLLPRQHSACQTRCVVLLPRSHGSPGLCWPGTSCVSSKGASLQEAAHGRAPATSARCLRGRSH